MRPPVRLRVLAAAAACVVAATVSGCTVVRNELGPTDGSCYVALPTAAGAVDHHGTLLGVRLFTVPSLRAPARMVFDAARSGDPRVDRVCLVGFSGHFHSAEVPHPRGRREGRVAIVVVSYPGNRLLATVIIDHPPLLFGHSHLAE